MTSDPPSHGDDRTDDGSSVALGRALRHGGVQLLRYAAPDAGGLFRCKAVPLDHLHHTGAALHGRATFAGVGLVGLPAHADAIVPASGIDAASAAVALRPDLRTLRVLPYAPRSALVLGDLVDAATGAPSPLCSRTRLRTLVNKCAREHGIGLNVGAELEFCLYTPNGRPVDASRYAGSTTLNQQQAFLGDLLDQLAAQEIAVELVHAESAPGQVEVVLRYTEDPLQLADDVHFAKETIVAVALAHHLRAVFVPKIDPMQAGNGCHLHLSLRETDAAVAAEPTARRVTDGMRRAFLEGVLAHLPALLALTLPSANSFRRVGAGCWTGHECAWAFGDKEAALRVLSQDCGHFEFKLCDARANLYLALVGIISAGLEGIQMQRQLREPRGSTAAAATASSPELPASLDKGLDRLEADTLLKTALGPELLQSFVGLKRAEVANDADKTLEQELQEALDLYGAP